jgi:two-component system, chemotaxis family, chemotaxis protein CheY
MPIDHSLRVLVVDDFATIIHIVRKLLSQLGFENVEDARDGEAALAKLRQRKYDLVICDWNMEPTTGYDLLLKVRADRDLAATPFIMITAESKPDNVIAARKAGVSNYIVKPFTADALKEKIDSVFGDVSIADKVTGEAQLV